MNRVPRLAADWAMYYLAAYEDFRAKDRLLGRRSFAVDAQYLPLIGTVLGDTKV